ncbi:dTDP-4-amino-4,6-dideoxygalactose transaminase [Methanomicrobiaceae archaeon CYW5]|uniref:dTDP-4-amino-4,6-dideoxygalactose transaminase n=1 Tax=Methanovulcanius yangii TaxID=1789227 RepID=UPI0029C9E3E6|nr:dTDP-4-amino-4,6-dideoxygalactose transaminase [Methanovulcanius yangii]MBT8507871.1 dTDP-4-amino-4,6-dideoxygalactose transaminase [Methanovulcanius yangii]
MIPYSSPSITSLEIEYVVDCLKNKRISGDGEYTKRVTEIFKKKFNINNFLLTTSCTHALELSAFLIDIRKGDEVIMPSYTFVSTANAFMLRGARPVFVDIDPLTLNMDSTTIEEHITPKTKAICPVHYAGVPCEMDSINATAAEHDIFVIEDAAQAVGSTYHGKYAGTLGDMGCYSFHETKNYCMGEGGGLVINDPRYLERAEILREKGTNRSQFIQGLVDKYTWHDIGSSYLPSDLLAALLTAQMERFEEIMSKRLNIWDIYNEAFKELEDDGLVIRPHVPNGCTHNAHIYYLILPSEEIRNGLLNHLNNNNIQAVFHYMPLHISTMGGKLGYKKGDLQVTEQLANNILRLPIFVDLDDKELIKIIDLIIQFLKY